MTVETNRNPSKAVNSSSFKKNNFAKIHRERAVRSRSTAYMLRHRWYVTGQVVRHMWHVTGDTSQAIRYSPSRVMGQRWYTIQDTSHVTTQVLRQMRYVTHVTSRVVRHMWYAARGMSHAVPTTR